MSTKTVAIVLALAACLLIGSAVAVSALKGDKCPGSVLDNVESQIAVCGRDVPVPMYGDPVRMAGMCVTAALNKRSGKIGDHCGLDKVPALLETCLRDNFVRDEDIAPAVQCMRSALSLGVCC